MKTRNKVKTTGQIYLIPQENIAPNPNQPRKRFDYEELEGLAQSIRINGILQPIT
ncbi:MAG: ParB N-terminal domain-containing protein, partial [Oscillospiraceae bacterium]